MKKSFYLKYIENKEKVKKENRIKKKYKLDDKTLIIEKSSNFFIQLISIITNILKDIFRWILYILLMGFTSVGITAIVNKDIRQIFINLIMEGR